MIRSTYWENLTTTDFAAPDVASWIVVLPIAAIEQHGPHLPLSTDTAIARGLISRTVELLPPGMPVVVLPVQPIGKSDEHKDFPGTLTLTWETAARSWIEIGMSVCRAGIKKLVIVTAHGGNVPVMDIVAQELRVRHAMLAVTTSWARMGVPDNLLGSQEKSYGIHGGEEETSLMLALHPDLVRQERSQDFASAQTSFESRFKRLRGHGPVQFGWKARDLNPDGVMGNAAAATAEKGRAIIDHKARAFLDVLRDVQHFDLSHLIDS